MKISKQFMLDPEKAVARLKKLGIGPRMVGLIDILDNVPYAHHYSKHLALFSVELQLLSSARYDVQLAEEMYHVLKTYRSKFKVVARVSHQLMPKYRADDYDFILGGALGVIRKHRPETSAETFYRIPNSLFKK